MGTWVTWVAKGVHAFYDIDTPITLEKLALNDCEYITPELVRRYRALSFFHGWPGFHSFSSSGGAHHLPGPFTAR